MTATETTDTESTAPAPPETPQDWLTRLEASPLILTGGRALRDWLARDTSLGPERADVALREYRRFLALALAAPGQPRMPGPMIAQLWQLHRDDSAAWQACPHLPLARHLALLSLTPGHCAAQTPSPPQSPARR